MRGTAIAPLLHHDGDTEPQTSALVTPPIARGIHGAPRPGKRSLARAATRPAADQPTSDVTNTSGLVDQALRVPPELKQAREDDDRRGHGRPGEPLS